MWIKKIQMSRKRSKRGKTFIKVTAFFVLSVLTAAFFLKDVNAQVYKAYQRLSEPEKRWVLLHPVAASKTYKLRDTVEIEVSKCRKNKELDGDGVGGQLDAFKHTLWMALCSQKIGRKKAVSLGKAHEDGNRAEFEKYGKKRGDQDSVLSLMDMLNNEIGAALGEKYPKISLAEMVDTVKAAVLNGQCYKTKKNSSRRYLDKDGNIIDTKKYTDVWNVPKIIVKSDYKPD